MRSQFLVSFANRQLSMDAQQIELEIPGLRRQKNHQKHQKTAFKKSFGLYDFSHVVHNSLFVPTDDM